jgi:hypothetical protein
MRRALFALGAVAAAALLFLAFRSGKSAPARAMVAEDDARGSLPRFPSVPSEPEPGAPALSEVLAGPTPPSEAEMRKAGLEHIANTRKLYVEYATYPVWSRPYDQSWAPFKDWNGERKHVDKNYISRDGKPVEVSYALDKNYARPGEAITATVTVDRLVAFSAAGEIQIWSQADFDRQALDPTVRFPGYKTIAAVRFEPAPDNPLQLQARFVPSEIPALMGKQLAPRFVGLVSIPGQRDTTTKPVPMEFRYAVREPVRVLGMVEQHIDEKGSLSMTFDVEIDRAKPVKVAAVIFDASGQKPIAIVNDFWRPAKAGRQHQQLTVFGRALHDKGIDGPYTFQLHGYLMLLGEDPDEIYWNDTRTYSTKAFDAHAFSNQPWDDPFKDDMVRTYDRLANEIR